MKLRRLALAGPLALLALPGAAAADPTLSVDRPCYTPGQAINATGTGYTPGGNVQMAESVFSPYGNKYYFRPDPLVADPNGNISDRLAAPDLASNHDFLEDAALFADDQQKDDQGLPPDQTTGVAPFKLSIFDVFVPPWDSHKVDPKKVTTVRAFGFEGLGPVLYAHYLLHGKVKKTVRIGALRGDCGNVTKKMKQFPFRPVPAGDYRIAFDTSRAYSSRADGIVYPHVKVPARKAVR